MAIYKIRQRSKRSELGVKLNTNNSLCPDAQCVIPSIYTGELVSGKRLIYKTANHKLSPSVEGTVLERIDRAGTVFVDLEKAPILSTSDGCSIVFRYNKQNVNTFSQTGTFSSSVDGYINLQVAGGTVIDLRHRNGFSFSFSAASEVPAFEWHDYAITARGTDRNLFIDGVYVETQTSGGSDFEFDRLMSSSHGYMLYAYTYHRELNEGDIRSLSVNPNQVLQNKRKDFYFTSGAAPAATNRLLSISQAMRYGGMGL